MDELMKEKESCALAGLHIGQGAPYEDYFCIFPINLMGLVKDRDWEVPHSELAMHTGVAGDRIIAACINRKNKDTKVVTMSSKGCKSAYGLRDELISREITNAMDKVFRIG